MQPLPGFRDFYPETLAVRRHIFSKWRETARRYGFREYDGPPLEPLELFTLKSGDEIVHQLFNFTDKGDRAVALRPEMTPTLARMAGARHRDYKKPLKWFAVPQLFRYEKQQRGRLREHFQFNADIIGEADIAADAELIALAIDSLRAFGLTERDFVVRVNNREFTSSVLRHLGIAENKLHDAFVVIDKIDREKPEVTRQKLKAFGLAESQVEKLYEMLETGRIEDSQTYFLFEALKMKGLSEYVRLDLKIVRGLAYYTGIVWEIHDRKGELRAIAGGGRYDNLLKLVGGVDLPALGFGMGDVVLGELLKDRGLLPKLDWQLDCYVVVADESLRPAALKLVHDLRDTGVSVDYSLTPVKVAKQFQNAAALGARFGVVVGPEEWAAGEVTLKNLGTGEQTRIKCDEVAKRIS